MSKKIVTALLVLTCFFTVYIAFQNGSSPGELTKPGGKDKVGIIKIEGTISGDSSESILGESVSSLESTLEALKEARENDDIKAVVVRINSPGGTVAASQEIAEEIGKVKETEKPVICSMGDIAASGGYWIASECDTIVANPGTLTGSIGVIMETPNVQGLMQKLGISDEVIKSGTYKDIGSSTRQMTPDERKLLQDLVGDSYAQFLDQVKKGRKGKINEAVLPSLADGRVFTGRQAKKLGLVDRMGNYQDAVDLAIRQADLDENAQVEEINKADPWERLLGSISSLSPMGQSRLLKSQY